MFPGFARPAPIRNPEPQQDTCQAYVRISCMHPDIKRLMELQATDVRLSELRARLASFSRQLAEIDSRVVHARQQLAAVKEALTASLTDRKTYEMDVDSWKERARKYRDQSFQVKTNEAFKALQNEIQHAEDQVAQTEDRLLERMVAGEEFERQVKAAESEIAVVERNAEAGRQKLEAERAALQEELEPKNAEREREASSIPAELFEQYERIARRHQGLGLAAVRYETCSLCGLRIRPHVFQELRRDTSKIFQCETCSRILYYVEPPPAAAPEPAGSPSSAADVRANED